MSTHLIRIIAMYEMKTLLRSWFFRLFAGGAIFFLGIFNIAMNVNASGAPWIYNALSASIPYVNLIVLNLGQAVVAIFLASEFLKQDRKNDTVEVIYARSMSNSQYIAGKSLGILAIFFLLNLVILLMGIGFSFLSNASSQRIMPYLAYPMLISLPTLTYILGLSFFLMVLIKNQAVTFILLAGYIALCVFYLNKKAYNIFDYIAYQIPMMYSSISGFADFKQILIHRSIYLFLGLGLISITAFKLGRLPQRPVFKRLPLYTGLLLIVVASLLVFKYLQIRSNEIRFKQEVIRLNDQYSKYPRLTVDSCYINLSHQKEIIAVKARLSAINNSLQKFDTIILCLNPDLIVNKILVNKQEITFQRKLQIINIPLREVLDTNERVTVELHYKGGIDERITFLDKDPVKYNLNFNMEVFTLHKRTAFLQKNYVCLTSASLWYPVSGTYYNPSDPFGYQPDFVNYDIDIHTSPNLKAICQGKLLISDQGNFHYSVEYPLPQIALVIGNYKQYTLQVDSVEYSLYCIKGNDFFTKWFTELSDTIPTLIRELKKKKEVELGLQYPFNRFVLVEVPVHFSLDKHLYSYASDAVQPEMILYPEKGVMFDRSDFGRRKFRIEKDAKNQQQEKLPVEIQAQMFNDFFEKNLLARKGESFYHIDYQTYNLSPQFHSFYSSIRSLEWPVLSLAAEVFLNEVNSVEPELRWYEGVSIYERINLELSEASFEDILKNGIKSGDLDRDQFMRDMAHIKGLYLFNMLKSKVGDKEMDAFFKDIIRKYPYSAIPFSYFRMKFKARFQIDLDSEMLLWYRQKELPAFVLKDVTGYKVPDNEMIKYQIRFKISNIGHTGGLVSVNVEYNDPNRTQNSRSENESNGFKNDFTAELFVPASSALEVGYVLPKEPARMSLVTHISRNLPNNIIYNYNGFNETRNVALLNTQIAIPYYETHSDSNEIVVDNEDKGFSFDQTTDDAYLKSIIKKSKKEYVKYSPIWSWNPPAEWKAVLRSEFFGNYIHSAYYTKAGSGERIARWITPLPEKGRYDVYMYFTKINLGWRQSKRQFDYNISIFTDNGVEKVNQNTQDIDNGWIYMGSYPISSDTGKVEMSNLSKGDMIFADAVKWVIVE